MHPFLFCAGLTSFLLVTACGGDDKDQGYPEACEESVPTDIQAQIETAHTANVAARDAAVEAERARLGVTALTPSLLLGYTTNHSVPHKPETDPYPESVVVSGDLTLDIRANGYAVNHGNMGQTNIYETAPGSGEYFIVDVLGGDGIGGNGAEVAAYTEEFSFLETRIDPLTQPSFHSWHVSPDNVLVRAKQKTDDVVLGELTLCGCPPGYGLEAPIHSKKPAADVAPPTYPVAIFKLPGKAVPQISTDAFEAKYTRSYFKKRYVPKKGQSCAKNGGVVC